MDKKGFETNQIWQLKSEEEKSKTSKPTCYLKKSAKWLRHRILELESIPRDCFSLIILYTSKLSLNEVRWHVQDQLEKWKHLALQTYCSPTTNHGVENISTVKNAKVVTSKIRVWHTTNIQGQCVQPLHMDSLHREVSYGKPRSENVKN